MKCFKTLISGLGSIGMGYDYDTGSDGAVLSHAAAVREHDGFELCAGLDPDPVCRKRFTDRFNAPAFSGWPELPDSLHPEVLIAASPTEFHQQDVLTALDRGVRGILCEKPLADSVEAGCRMVDRAAAEGCILAVNYIRRFEPGTLDLRRRLMGGEWGPLVKGTVWYTKGLFNNASHFIDLLIFFFGPPSAARVLRNNRFLKDWDPEPDFVLSWEDGADVYFSALSAENFSIAEMTLICRAGVIRYQRGGFRIQVQAAAPDPLFPGGTVLEKAGGEIKTDFEHYQRHALDAFYQALRNGEPPVSSGETALETLRVVEELYNKVKRDE